MKSRSFLVSALCALGCGGGGGGDAPLDARLIDAPTLDAAELDADLADADVVDATPLDAMPVTYHGEIEIVEEAILNPGTSGTYYGQGVRLRAAFHASTDLPAPILEELPGTGYGCKAWEYTPAQAAVADVGRDEGTIAFSFTGTTPPSYPTCTWAAGGYECSDFFTLNMGGGITVSGGDISLQDADVAYTAANSVNRYLEISGAAAPGNNGRFPILYITGGNTLHYVNPLGSTELLPLAAVHRNLSLYGPTPGMGDPGFLADDLAMTVTITQGGEGHVESFSAPQSGSTIGDDFELEPAELQKLNALPTDGGALTISCTEASCPNFSAYATILDLTTTDAPTAGLSPFAMPAPTTRRVHVRCMMINTRTITAPAEFMALIAGANATRIEARLARTAQLSGPSTEMWGGHAILGYTDP